MALGVTRMRTATIQEVLVRIGMIGGSRHIKMVMLHIQGLCFMKDLILPLVDEETLHLMVHEFVLLNVHFEINTILFLNFQ